MKGIEISFNQIKEIKIIYSHSYFRVQLFTTALNINNEPPAYLITW